jgi:site-specific recombinase XerD
MFSTLREFLRYLYIEGEVHQDLSEAVPTLHRRELSRVPRCISEEHTKQLLDSIDRSESIGKRDYAIIQILNTYGVRGVHVRKLRLEDVYWHENKIVFAAVKGGKRIIQHLTPAVGNSILGYLQHARQKDTAYREVFLTCTKTPKPLRLSGNVSSMIIRRLKNAGIKLPDGVPQGSHSFRHAFATRMVCGSQPFKYVADMLGHKIIDSTMVYTKIDLPAMRQATLEWPEVSS